MRACLKKQTKLNQTTTTTTTTNCDVIRLSKKNITYRIQVEIKLGRRGGGDYLGRGKNIRRREERRGSRKGM